MAVRIRADRKVIVCAAMSDAEDGDCYLDDNIHYELSVELGALCCIGKNNDGADLWEFCAPGTPPSLVWRNLSLRGMPGVGGRPVEGGLR